MPHRLTEATIRGAWQRLIAEDLPRAARLRGWPLRAAADFERVFFDQILSRPCRLGARLPAMDLVLAIELANRALDGRICLDRLNRRSQAMRATQGHPAE